MTIDMAEKTIDWMFSIYAGDNKEDTFKITIHGGEPLLAGYDVIGTIIKTIERKATMKNFQIGIQSNLWLLDEKFCDLFKKYGVCLGTSLDGPEDVNDLNRGTGYFKKTMAGIKVLRSFGLQPGVIATATKLTLPYWQNVLDFFKNERLSLSIHPAIYKLSTPQNYFLSPEDYTTLLLKSIDYYLANIGEIRIQSLDSMIISTLTGISRTCTFAGCTGLFIVVDPAGDIYPCQRFAGQKAFRIGSIHENLNFNQIYARIIDHPCGHFTAQADDRCKKCTIKSYCHGGCYHNALSAGQSSDPYCVTYKTLFKSIKLKLLSKIPDILSENSKFSFFINQRTHPFIVTANAKRIIAAYFWAKYGDTTIDAMYELKIGKTQKRLAAALNDMKTNMIRPRSKNNIYLHITFRCQLRCTHCYNKLRSNDAVALEMSLSDIEQILKDPHVPSFRQLIITGGEPLFHVKIKQIIELILKFRECNRYPKVILRSNFVALPKDDLSLLQLSRAFNSIIVSLDGGEEEHDIRRGKGVYHVVVKNLYRYQDIIRNQKGCAELSLAASLNKEDYFGKAAVAVKTLANRLNIKRVRFNPILPIGRAKCYKENFDEEPANYTDPSQALNTGFSPVFNCGIGTNLYIEPSGDVFPCYVINNLRSKIGNTKKNDLMTIINSNSFRQLSLYSVDNIVGCSECDYRYLCGGMCRIRMQKKEKYQRKINTPTCCNKREKSTAVLNAAAAYLGIELEEILTWRKT